MCQELKTCSTCNIPKPLTEFDTVFQKSKGISYTEGYCKACKKEKRRVYGLKYYAENKDKRKKYEQERRKRPDYNVNHRKYKKQQMEVLTDGMVASWLSQKMKIPVAEIYKIEGLIEAERGRLKLSREIRKIETADPNFRVCSKCNEKKPISEFKVRTEHRKGKPPYTYTSGQCKKCESIIKNSYGKKQANRS